MPTSFKTSSTPFFFFIVVSFVHLASNWNTHWFLSLHRNQQAFATRLSRGDKFRPMFSSVYLFHGSQTKDGSQEIFQLCNRKSQHLSEYSHGAKKKGVSGFKAIGAQRALTCSEFFFFFFAFYPKIFQLTWTYFKVSGSNEWNFKSLNRNYF